VFRALTATLVALLVSAATARAQAPTTMAAADSKALNLAAYAELLRADVRSEKIAILTEVMGFTETESQAFWPIYREYDTEMSKLGDERVALIAEYGNNFSNLSDATADKLAAKALDLEARRQAVKAKYYERTRKALSAKTALRFLQVEQQLLLIIDLQILASLPLVK
jgi:hypothetical protein